jgi:hypothetical protein
MESSMRSTMEEYQEVSDTHERVHEDLHESKYRIFVNFYGSYEDHIGDWVPPIPPLIAGNGVLHEEHHGVS